MNLDLKKITKDDIFYYVLPEGSTLYKGLVNEERITNIAQYEWYGMSEKVAEIYGHIYLYVLKKQVLLYAMDERSNVEQLLRDARAQSRNDVVEAIKDTFQLFPDTNEVIRHSDPDNDKIVAEFICLNRAGYAADQLRKWKDSVNYFHSEIMLNNANTLVEYANKKIKTSVSSTVMSNRLAPKKGPRPSISRTPEIIRNTTRRLFSDDSQSPSPFKMRRVENDSFEDFQPLFSPQKSQSYLSDDDGSDEDVENMENVENAEDHGMEGDDTFVTYDNVHDITQELYLQKQKQEMENDLKWEEELMRRKEMEEEGEEGEEREEEGYEWEEREVEDEKEEQENSFSSARKNLFSQFEEARVLF